MPRTRGSKNKNINTAKNKILLISMSILQNQKKEEDGQKSKVMTQHNIDNQVVWVVWHLLK
jgi:hypothetical protein